MLEREKQSAEKIIAIGKRLYQRNLAVAASGNISLKLSDKNILITGAQTQLSDLNYSDIVKVNITNNKTDDGKIPSSELPLHNLVYKNFKAKAVLHCHPPLINGYFAVNQELKALTFETRFYLGDIPVVKQDTPTVTNPEEVVEALKLSNIVVLKNHGVIAIADNFLKALALVEALEEAVKSAVVAEIFKKEIGRGNQMKGSRHCEGPKAPKQSCSQPSAYPMFSKDHIKAIVDLVNQDDFISAKGKELDLTVELAIKLSGSDKAYKFIWDKGRIKELKFNAQAPFVISASADIWREVFLGRLDPFVAVTQGKMSLDGQLGQLSKWYVPFSRLFEIFKEVRFKEPK
ncbi:MAG: class II aldolase/adducin family protein [Candidatus Omnitrophica bacterium]|nr:class II aldolase/adducin family protein [Candidatus Omnitrophota bacterium]MCF7878557.1 class II aldolase/adducin family protein [Candidatus Omnitrophota bacterium]